MKNGTLASPAMARASSVLPVPGGPNSSTPLGILAPSDWNFLGFSRNSLISWSSSTASSAPATSLNVTFGESTLMRFALLLPKLITREPPPCIWFIRNRKTSTTPTIGVAQRRHQALAANRPATMNAITPPGEDDGRGHDERRPRHGANGTG